jgi:hypothetical protein
MNAQSSQYNTQFDDVVLNDIEKGRRIPHANQLEPDRTPERSFGRKSREST